MIELIALKILHSDVLYLYTQIKNDSLIIGIGSLFFRLILIFSRIPENWVVQTANGIEIRKLCKIRIKKRKN